MSTDHVRENWLWDAIYDARQQPSLPEGSDQEAVDKFVAEVEVAVETIADKIVPYIYWRGRMDALEALAVETTTYMGLNFTVAKHFVQAGEEFGRLGLPGGDLWMSSKDPGYSGEPADV